MPATVEVVLLMAPKCSTCPRRVNRGRVTGIVQVQCQYCRQRYVQRTESAATIDAALARAEAEVKRRRPFSVSVSWQSPLARIA